MTSVKTMLELRSPKLKRKEETTTVEGLKCNYCEGNGWFWGTDELGEDTKVPCPMCQGSGKLNAEITIRWKPWEK